MNVRFLYPAEIELFDAAVFYEQQVENLGQSFLSIMEAAINDLRSQPESWPEIKYGIRKRPLRRFPYSVLYRIGKGEIVIVAVMHQRRHPRYWAERVK